MNLCESKNFLCFSSQIMAFFIRPSSATGTVPKGRGRILHRTEIEHRISEKRQKEYMRLQHWSDVDSYYKHFENQNSKFGDWTSSRYYETQKVKMEEAKKELQKKESLEKRREKLRKLIFEEEQSYNIELTVKNREKFRRPRLNEIPTELLRDVNVGLKMKEEERRQKEAELALYHQWRNNSSSVREYERNLRSKELKLSWLDQQIEKRMKKERQQEECKKMLAERDKRLAKLKEEEEDFKKQQKEKQERLRKDLEHQMEILSLKAAETERLKAIEQERLKEKLKLDELIAAKHREEERIKACELALYNVRHHRMKLKQRSQTVEEELKQQEAIIKQLRDSQIADAIEDARKKKEWKEAVDQFLDVLGQQRALEKKRQEQMDFVFDSEANAILKKQTEIWDKEKAARKQLLDDVVDAVRKQIQLKVEQNRKEQMEVILEREKNLELLEKYNEELEKAKEEEKEKQAERKKELDEQVKEKVELRRQLKTMEQKNLDLELQKTREEEERLKKEIAKMQRQRPTR